MPHTHTNPLAAAHCRECLTFAIDLRARDESLRAWLGERCSYHPDELPDDLKPTPTNEERSRAEVIEFLSQPVAYGVPYSAYLSSDRKRVTTFMGDTLAMISRIKTNPSRRRWSLSAGNGSFWARGIDGRLYYGRHNGPNCYLRMRLAKQRV